MNLSVGGIWLGDGQARVAERWGKPSEIKNEPWPGEPEGTPSPYVSWLYSGDERICFYNDRVESLFATNQRLLDDEATLPGPRSTFKELLEFWGPPLSDEYHGSKNLSYQLVGKAAVIIFEHDGVQCTSMYVVKDTRVPGPKK